MAMVVAMVVAMVMAWIGHGRIGVRGMRLELCVLGRIGCGGGANVAIVGRGRTHRTVSGALPAVISDRRGRDAERRKLTRPLRIGGYGSWSARWICRVCRLLVSRVIVLIISRSVLGSSRRWMI